ncbi:MAG TPA: SDR family oxidoreductase [Flavobacteriales bacterium]|nr:SDR family oxidoreductase [Flavobacteriales bacterium]
MSWSNLNCAVTGGAGFIGSHVAETLSKKGAIVTVLDDLSTGREANLELLYDLGVEFVQGSILDKPLLEKTFTGMDYVFHYAALPSVPRSIADPLLFSEVNLTGTLWVLEAARQAGVKKVVYAASSSAYGDISKLSKAEAQAASPLSPYAVTKLAAEHYCVVYSLVYGLPTASLRYFNVYGPRQNPNSRYAAVVPNFITAAMHGESPLIRGDGEQSRDFVFVDDAVRASLKAVLSSETDGIVVNIATGQRITINKLAAAVIRLVGADVEPKYVAAQVGDIRHSLADISRARKLIGYEPRYSLEQGLQKTVEYFIRQ